MERPSRSLLFTPATRPQSFERGLHSGADILCIDLEDAVPPDQKDAVRAQAIGFLCTPDGGRAEGPSQVLAQRCVRMNHPGSLAGLMDLAAIAEAAPRDGLLLVPKVAHAAELRLIDAILTEAQSGLHLAALIETLDGLDHVGEIAQASPRLTLLVFGAVDLSGEMGAENATAPMAYARGRVVHAGKRAGLDVMDVPELDFRNLDKAREAALYARALGFTGKAAIHPAGLSTINDAFTPSPEQIAQAQRVIAAYEASPNGLAVIDGQLIEAPVVRAMQRRLAIARVAGALEAE